MKYTKQELVWLKNLADKAVIEASENMKCNNPGVKAIAELHRDNMQDLSDKLQKNLEQLQRLGRIERQER